MSTREHEQTAGAPVTPRLSTSAPGPQARKVYALLCELENNARAGVRSKQTILGQHCEAHKETSAGEYWHKVGDITAADGGVRRCPGFVEFDLGPGLYRSTYREKYVDDAVAFARARFEEGEAIVGFSFHQSWPGAPVKSWENCFPKPEMDDAWFGRVVRAGTPEHAELLEDLSFAADKLRVLERAGVPVLFRPLHEMNKKAEHHPFWWSARDPALYRKLWAIQHDYLTRIRKLTNLIFAWSPYAWDGTYGGDARPYYPGSDRLDVVAVDIYHGNPYYPARFYDDLRPYDKPRMLAECDKMPVRWREGRYDSVSEIDARPWTIWSVWGDSLVYEVGTKKPNDWNVSGDYKAIRDTYAYRTGDHWRVLSGGPNPTYRWADLR